MKLKFYFLTFVTFSLMSCSENDGKEDMNLHVSGIPHTSGNTTNFGQHIAQASLLQLEPHSIRVGDEYLLARPSGSLNNGHISFDYTYYRMVDGKTRRSRVCCY